MHARLGRPRLTTMSGRTTKESTIMTTTPLSRTLASSSHLCRVPLTKAPARVTSAVGGRRVASLMAGGLGLLVVVGLLPVVAQFVR